MKTLFIPVVAGLKKMILTGSLVGLITGTAAQQSQPLTRFETCTVHSQNELVDCGGNIWYIENQNLPLSESVVVEYLINDENDPYDDEIVSIYHEGWRIV